MLSHHRHGVMTYQCRVDCQGRLLALELQRETSHPDKIAPLSTKALASSTVLPNLYCLQRVRDEKNMYLPSLLPLEVTWYYTNRSVRKKLF
jgi:hypothetical protein